MPMKWDNVPEECREFLRSGKIPPTGFYWKNPDGTVGQCHFGGEEVKNEQG